MVLVEDKCRIERESGLKSIWYERGQFPTIRVDQKREGTSFYGALDVKLGRYHLWDTQDKYQGLDVLLIWDGAPSHRGEVKNYLHHKPP